MGLQFYNINKGAYVKPVSRVNNIIKTTALKKKKNQNPIKLEIV